MKPLIAVIDDDADMVGIYHSVLHEHFDVEEYYSPQAALEALPSSSGLCAILSDMIMPGLHGADFIVRLREAGLAQPVVLVTGLADRGTLLKALRAGAFALVEKPFQDAELVEAMTRAAHAHLAAATTRELANKYRALHATLPHAIDAMRFKIDALESHLAGLGLPAATLAALEPHLKGLRAAEELMETLESMRRDISVLESRGRMLEARAR